MRGEGTLEELIRERIRPTIEAIVEEEMAAALGTSRSARVGAIRTGRSPRQARTHVDDQPGGTHDRDAARVEADDERDHEW